ncbi:hypothetical protein HYS48_01350 [Candidatus Woesearchaeota archaeon]|nr:hypothetical protein [Candidatus Woesearchaeota archaeon]
MRKKRVRKQDSGVSRAKQQQPSPTDLHRRIRTILYPPGKIPIGMKALILYSVAIAFLYLSYLFLGLYQQSMVVFRVFQGPIPLYLLIIGLLLAVVFGIVERKAWGYQLTMVWFSLSIILSLISTTWFDPQTFPLMRRLLFLSASSIILLDLVVLWYVSKKKAYFSGRPFTVTKADKIFVHFLSIFWLVIILLSGVLGWKFYQQTTNIADGIVEELRGTGIVHALILCDSKQGMEQDVCYTVVATIYHTEQDVGGICERISSDFFTLTCYQVRA